jgi:hypothetical protein
MCPRLLALLLLAAAVFPERGAAAPPRSAGLTVTVRVVRRVEIELPLVRAPVGAAAEPAPIVFIDGAPPNFVVDVPPKYTRASSGRAGDAAALRLRGP